MKIQVSAPSNIALIKYMGKIPTSMSNRPTNSSLSYTLESLRTSVELTPIEGELDQWQPLVGAEFEKLDLSEKGQQRFLNHFRNLKNEWNLKGSYLIRSASNFPSDCGLASSASSFAALTIAAGALATSQGRDDLNTSDLAEASRKGSGSSCRSFFGPWVLWGSSGVRPLEFPMQKLLHFVVVIDAGKKEVSSSEAHQRVVSSPLFARRPERAEERLAKMVLALKAGEWQEIFEIAWAEFWDMHSLFETSKPAFGYFEPGTMEVLRDLRSMWAHEKDGPLVTMDAGANVHVLFRHDQKERAQKWMQEWSSRFRIFSSESSQAI